MAVLKLLKTVTTVTTVTLSRLCHLSRCICFCFQADLKIPLISPAHNFFETNKYYLFLTVQLASISYANLSKCYEKLLFVLKDVKI